MRRCLSIVGLCGIGVAAVFAQQQDAPWMPMDRSPTSAYHATGLGDPLSAAGATLHIIATRADDHPFGSVAQHVDATAFRGHRITLSAALSVRDAM